MRLRSDGKVHAAVKLDYGDGENYLDVKIDAERAKVAAMLRILADSAERGPAAKREALQPTVTAAEVILQEKVRDLERDLAYRVREDDQRHRSLLNDLRNAGLALDRFGEHADGSEKFAGFVCATHAEGDCDCGLRVVRFRIAELFPTETTA